MYQHYLKVKFRILYRSIQGIGLLRFAFIFILLVFGSLALCMNAEPRLIPIIFLLFIFFYHSYRKDKKFLQVYFRQTYLLFWFEYALLSLPFIALSLIRQDYISLLAYPILVFLSPFIFNKRLQKWRLSFPFLSKGSYEFQTGFRSQWLVFICSYLVAFLGIYNGNHRILYFCTLLITFLLGMMQTHEDRLCLRKGVGHLCSQHFMCFWGKNDSTYFSRQQLCDSPIFCSRSAAPGLIVSNIPLCSFFIALCACSYKLAGASKIF